MTRIILGKKFCKKKKNANLRYPQRILTTIDEKPQNRTTATRRTTITEEGHKDRMQLNGHDGLQLTTNNNDKQHNDQPQLTTERKKSIKKTTRQRRTT